MCSSPFYLPNPNKGRDLSRSLAFLYDTTSDTIPIPCGHCKECIARRQTDIVQAFQIEIMESDLFFFTLTYNDNIPVITTPVGNIQYPDISDVQNMFKRLRRYNKFGEPFKYFVVSERGTKKFRPHYHGVIAFPKIKDSEYMSVMRNRNREYNYWGILLNEWKRNIGSTRSPVYLPLCTYERKNGRYNYDFHWLDPKDTAAGEADVAFYVTKYITKYDNREHKLLYKIQMNTQNTEEFKDYRRMIRTRYFASKSFGKAITAKQIAHIRKGIEYAKHNDIGYACFINPISGRHFPLAPRYRKFLTIDDALTIYYNRQTDNIDNSFVTLTDIANEAQKRRLKNQQQKNFEKNMKKNAKKFVD